jgi:cyanophycin synthetase
VPLSLGGRIAFEVENALATVAAALCLGVPREVICTRAESFAADMSKVPGRFNLFDIRGATVIVDYGHNAHSLTAMVAALETFPHGRRTCVYSTAGDRRDADIIRQGEILGNAFDRVILFEDHCTRGRAEGEIIGLFRQGLARGRRVKQIEQLRGSVKAVQAALDSATPGELMLLQADTIEETVNFMREYLQNLAAEEGEEEEGPPAATPQAGEPAATSAEVPAPALAEAPAAVKV